MNKDYTMFWRWTRDYNHTNEDIITDQINDKHTNNKSNKQIDKQLTINT